MNDNTIEFKRSLERQLVSGKDVYDILVNDENKQSLFQIEDIIRKCTRLNPSDRISSAELKSLIEKCRCSASFHAAFKIQ